MNNKIEKYFLDMKKNRDKITVLTCYDAEMAGVLSEAGVDVLLVGDSVGMVKLGYESTVSVSVDEMIHHAKAVKRGNKGALIVVDVPFAAKKISDVVRLYKKSQADAVKIEVFHKNNKHGFELIKKTVAKGIPVMGHIGLTPQYVKAMGGYKVQGKDVSTARELVKTAKLLEKTGVFSIVIECVPASLAGKITETVRVPTIGIGAGVCCDGQVLVLDDMLGVTDKKLKFVKRFTEIRKQISLAVLRYCGEVKKGKFPDKEHSFL